MIQDMGTRGHYYIGGRLGFLSLAGDVGGPLLVFTKVP